MTLLWNENLMFSTAVIHLASGFHPGYENLSHVYTPGNMLYGLLEENQLDILREGQVVIIGLNQYVSLSAPLLNANPQ